MRRRCASSPLGLRLIDVNYSCRLTTTISAGRLDAAMATTSQREQGTDRAPRVGARLVQRSITLVAGCLTCKPCGGTIELSASSPRHLVTSSPRLHVARRMSDLASQRPFEIDGLRVFQKRRVLSGHRRPSIRPNLLTSASPVEGSGSWCIRKQPKPPSHSWLSQTFHHGPVRCGPALISYVTCWQ
jgi:hypothetical protein